MTRVPFELHVTIRPENGRPETYESVEFRFGTKQARALERAAGSGIAWLHAQGRAVEALVLLVCYGLKLDFPKMNEDKATDIIDAYIDRGGNTKLLADAASKALYESGLYGRAEDDAELESDARVPLETKTGETPLQPLTTG